MVRKFMYIVSTMLLMFSITACNSTIQVKPSDIDQIKLELVSYSKLPNGNAYTVKLRNLSKFKIAQNDIYLSYLIKTTSGGRTNDFKVMARNNKLNIKPNEEIFVDLFAPIEEFAGNQKLDTETPYIEIIGYLEEVKEERRFQKTGQIDYFK
ncbi:hypothetical protein [Cohnella soli]|uniref:Lipoprotein n=1 Tax=Cohnella soli TaxID=425005 RepID=A0ABW0HXY1_9BACL